MKKRLFPILLAIVMSLSLLPVSAMDIMGVRIIEDLVLRNLLLVQELANSR